MQASGVGSRTSVQPWYRRLWAWLLNSSGPQIERVRLAEIGLEEEEVSLMSVPNLGKRARLLRSERIARRTAESMARAFEDSVAVSRAEEQWPKQRACTCCQELDRGCILPPLTSEREPGKRCRHGFCACWGGDIGLCEDCARYVWEMLRQTPEEWVARNGKGPRDW